MVLHAVIRIQPGSSQPTSVGYSSSVRPDSRAPRRHRSDLPQVAKLRCCGVGVANPGNVLQAHRSDVLRLATSFGVDFWLRQRCSQT